MLEIMNPAAVGGGVAAATFFGILASLALGRWIGRRMLAKYGPVGPSNIGSLETAVFALLGLLIAFTFSGGLSRFDLRRAQVVQEANAIGTAYLRADLLDEPHASELRAALKRYTEHRIELATRLRQGLPPGAAAEVEGLHSGIWNAAIAGVTASPAAMLGVLPPVNEVIDLHSTRIAAGRKHLPMPVVGLLIACSVLSMGVIGYGSGIGGRRRAPLTISLALLIATALWITIDLDYPRAGLLQLSDAPLKALTFDKTP
jgi:hypothetical protein